MNAGILLGLGSYLIWGLFPLYYRLLQRIPALELVAHRVIWSLLLLAIGIVAAGRWRAFRAKTGARGIWRFHAVTGLLIGANWLLYVWGVNEGRVVECSLGYFLNPLVNVALGVVILRERLRVGQWIGVGLATLGVLYLTFRAGTFPWLSLSLALSFGLYGLLKKRAPLGSIDGLLAETLALCAPALAWILWREIPPTGALHTASVMEWLLLVGTGVVTTVPLLMFSAAMRRVPLSVMGFLQYVTPTMQFLIGVLWFREAFGPERLHGFGLVWAGLAVVGLDSVRHRVVRGWDRRKDGVVI